MYTPTPWIIEEKKLWEVSIVANNHCEVASLSNKGRWSEQVIGDEIIKSGRSHDRILGDAALIVKAVNSYQAMKEAIELALKELVAISARDGAPQHIDWYQGRPLQVNGCSPEWFEEVIEKCEKALTLAEGKE